MNSNVKVNNKLENISKKLDKKGMNQISNISYNVKDLSGNQYRVKSEFGESLNDLKLYLDPEGELHDMGLACGLSIF